MCHMMNSRFVLQLSALYIFTEVSFEIEITRDKITLV